MKKMNLCLAANNNYAMQTGVTVVSFLENHKESKITVYIIENDFDSDNITKFSELSNKYNAEILMINPSNVLDRIEKLSFMQNISKNGEDYAKKVGAAAYSRLFITELLPKHVDRVLYVDSDIIVHSNLENIYNMKINKGIAAVIDVWPAVYNEKIGLHKEDIYYSAGVQLIDLKYMREHKCQEKIWDYMNVMNRQYRLFDQDIMNILFHDTITRMPLECNLMGVNRLYSIRQIKELSQKNETTFYTEEEQKEALKNPKIFHFAGDFFGKPWVFPYANEYTKEWLYFFQISPWGQKPLRVYLNQNFFKYYFCIVKKLIKKYIYLMYGIEKVYDKQLKTFIADANME